MLRIVCVIALAALASASTHRLTLPMWQVNPLFGNRIVGGEDYDIKQVPYQISLQIGTFHTCGGSILDKRHVMTASHCIVGNEGSWSQYHIRAGSSINSQGGQYIKIAKFHSHPDYNAADSWTNDIAVLELAEDLVFGDGVQPITLPKQGAAVPFNEMAVASGWGRLSSGGSLPRQLQGVIIPINEPEVCEQAYGSSSFKRATMVCAASVQGGHSTCQGDSGGPLVHKGVQYGIVSWAAGCASPNYPTVFAHVANLRSFVTDVTGL